MEKTEKVTFIHSISFKILILVAAIVLYSLVGSVLSANSSTTKIVEKTYEDYLLSLAEQGARTISNIPQKMVGSGEYTKVMQGIEMIGVESAYAYLVDADGTMLYHPTAEKIGQTVENSVIKGVVAKIRSGKIPENAVVEYE